MYIDDFRKIYYDSRSFTFQIGKDYKYRHCYINTELDNKNEELKEDNLDSENKIIFR